VNGPACAWAIPATTAAAAAKKARAQ